MFRTIGKRLLLTRNSVVFIPTMGITNVLPKRPMEINCVKLMGTIVDDVQYFNNGIIKLHLKTVTEENSNCVHNVTIANRNLLNLIQHKLAPEQRLYIGGKLKTGISVIDQRRKNEVEILANELYLLEPNPKITDTNEMPVQVDENFVEILAFIGTHIRNEQTYSSFSIVTHFIKQKGKSTQSEDGEHHNILIYKNPNMQRFAQNLQKFDRIYLTGFMTYSTKVYSDGNEQRKGFIQPKNLVKLQRFDE